MRATRTFARLIWFHVPLRLGPKVQSSSATSGDASTTSKLEVKRIMSEKQLALDLLQA